MSNAETATARRTRQCGLGQLPTANIGASEA